MPYVKPMLSVAEGTWFEGTDISVKDLLDLLFKLQAMNPRYGYHREQFTTEESLREALKYAFAKGRPEVLYIAAHGDTKGIHGFHDDTVDRQIIKEAIAGVTGTTKRGILFGSCLFGTEENAKFFLEDPACKRISWIAGYSQSISWIDASILDLSFLQHLLFPSPGKGHPQPKGLSAQMRYAVGKVDFCMKGLADDLGFQVYARDRKGTVVALRKA